VAADDNRLFMALISEKVHKCAQGVVVAVGQPAVFVATVLDVGFAFGHPAFEVCEQGAALGKATAEGGGVG
jgi:hypothetical protein